MSDIVQKLRALEAWIRKPDSNTFNLNTDVFDEAAAEIERLRAALKDARVSVEGWADYASDYIKEKWDLKGDLARIDAALEGK